MRFLVLALAAGAIGGWLYAERGRLLRRSTWRMVRVSGWRRLLDGTTLHGYLYGRFPRAYVHLGARVIVPRLPRFLRDRLAHSYHGKVLPVDLGRRLISVRQEVELRDLEAVVPYSKARDLILQGPPDIAVYECPCRLTSPNPCEPTQVCLIVGQPIVDFTLEHHPHTSRRLTTQEALDLLEAEHRRGHVQTAYFKDAAADRFFAICNCCSCCCGAIAASTRYGVPMIASSGFVATMVDGRCTGCGACARGCAFDALCVDGGSVVVDGARCKGCGVCVDRCASQALRLVRDPTKSAPLDVDALLGNGHAPPDSDG